MSSTHAVTDLPPGIWLANQTAQYAAAVEVACVVRFSYWEAALLRVLSIPCLCDAREIFEFRPKRRPHALHVMIRRALNWFGLFFDLYRFAREQTHRPPASRLQTPKSASLHEHRSHTHDLKSAPNEHSNNYLTRSNLKAQADNHPTWPTTSMMYDCLVIRHISQKT